MEIETITHQPDTQEQQQLEQWMEEAEKEPDQTTKGNKPTKQELLRNIEAEEVANKSRKSRNSKSSKNSRHQKKKTQKKMKQQEAIRTKRNMTQRKQWAAKQARVNLTR